MENILQILVYILGFGMCLTGIALSMVTVSGTWLVLLAGLLFKVSNVSLNPSWTVLIVLAVMAILVEVFEALAGYFGVVKKGGSKFAGVVAGFTSFIGGIIGTIFIPIYILGSLIGLFIGGFLGAYVVEYYIKHNIKATNIAMGTVFARVFMMVLKVIVTILMIFILFLH
jgi:uncharacterized protein